MSITITEALAEIKTIGKRLAKKREFIATYLSRQEGIKDPLEKDGGSLRAIANERQAIADLEARVITLRRGIQKANDATVVTINGVSRPISDWLTWRRDVAPGYQAFLVALRNKLNAVRSDARRIGVSVVAVNTQSENTKPNDIVVNINEQDLAKEIEALEDTLGQLDGQLSLKNATVTIAA